MEKISWILCWPRCDIHCNNERARPGWAQDLVHIDDQVIFVGPKFKLRSVTVTSYCHDWQEDIKAIFDRSYDLRLVMSI